MEIELTDRLRQQADIILSLHDFTSAQDEELIQEWLQRIRAIPDQLYTGASQGFMEVFLTWVLFEVIQSRPPGSRG